MYKRQAMKLLGAALILCGAALQCHALLGARRQERAALRELSAALEGLERGIRASLMPLPRLLGQRGAGKYADAFFADVLAQMDEDDARILRLWYIERKSKDEITEAVCYSSTSSLYDLRNKALVRFALLYFGAGAMPSM